MPSSNEKNEPDQKAITLNKLGVDLEELAQAPQLGQILSCAEGGIAAVISAMRFSPHPAIQAFLDAYDDASITDRKLVPLEAFAVLAEVDIPELLGAIVLALGQQSATIIKVMLPTHHPGIIKKQIKYAKERAGYRDRQAINTMLHLLPTAKGPTINFFSSGQVTSTNDAQDPDDIEHEEVFPDLLITQKLLES